MKPSEASGASIATTDEPHPYRTGSKIVPPRSDIGTIVTVTERNGTRSRGSRTANAFLGYQDYRTTTTKTRYPDGTTTTERSESRPLIAMFLLLGLAVASSWRASTAPDWYWVLTSAVVSAMVVAVVVLYVAYLIKCPAAYFSLRRNR